MSIGSEKVPIRLIARGTESSNPLPSSGESVANLIFGSALGFRRHDVLAGQPARRQRQEQRSEFGGAD
jgi:hypothetical protein